MLLGAVSLSLLCIFSWSCSSRHATFGSTTLVDESAADASDPQITAALKVINEQPQSDKGYLQLAALYIRRARETGDFNINRKAMSAVDQALEREPGSIAARKLKFSLLATFHRFGEARDMAAELRDQYPDDPYAYGILTDANVELGDYDAALQAAQKMIDLKPNSSAYARVGHLRSLYGNHSGAIEMMTLAARTADPRDKEAQSWCLVTMGKEFFKAGEFEKAEKVFDEALQISPGYGLALVEKARVRAALGDYQVAADYLSRSQLRFPSPESLILSGDLYAIQGKKEEAEEKYREAEEVARGLEGDLHRFALLWADHDTRLEESLELAKNDYAINKDIYAADILAWCLYKNGRLSEAQLAIDQAMRLNTNDARILYHAGMISKAMGDGKNARRLLTLSLQTNPGFDLLQVGNARAALANL